MNKIKIISNFTESRTYFQKMLKENYTWNNFQITDNKYADYYVIINEASKNVYFDKSKTIILFMEPLIEAQVKYKKFMDSNKECFFHNINAIEWHIKKSYSELLQINIVKTKSISTITSGNYTTLYHKKRVHFLPYLDTLDNIDIFGKLNKSRNKEKKKGNEILTSLKNYKGPLSDKTNGLFQYKYTFASENYRIENYFTEKLVDAILSECLCFYCGCPNIEKFLDSRAYIQIDINKPKEMIEIIKNAIKNNEWEKRINIIKKEKLKILNKLQLFPTIEEIIKKYF